MRTINIDTAYRHTPIPNSFIDGYLTRANPMYSVIYIYFYRHCHTGACSVTTAGVAESFGILETDVINCLKYWEKTGLIRLAGEGEEYSIEFVPPEPVSAGKYSVGFTVPAASVVSIPTSTSLSEKEAEPSCLEIKPVVIETRPVYTIEELELYKNESSEVARLFSATEQAFGKLHHYNDLCVIFGIYDWLRLPLDVIELLLKYCADDKKLNMRYIERVAIDWAERGITSIEMAKEHIERCSEGYRDIMKALGRGGRAPATKERQCMDKWLDEYAMPLPVILEACDRTIMNTDKRVFAYCDKILTDWYKKGVTSLDGASRVSAEFAQTARNTVSGGTSPRNTGPMQVRKPSRFANFKQREYDFKEIERIERAYLELERDKSVR